MAAVFSSVLPSEVKSMDAIFFAPIIKDVQLSCLCGWIGSELDLDLITNFEFNLVCCPSCQNLDVNILIDDK